MPQDRQRLLLPCRDASLSMSGTNADQIWGEKEHRTSARAEPKAREQQWYRGLAFRELGKGGGGQDQGLLWSGGVRAGGNQKELTAKRAHTAEVRNASICTGSHRLLLWQKAPLGNWEGLQTPWE